MQQKKGFKIKVTKSKYMKKLFVLIFMMLLSLIANANPMELDGINYNLNLEEKTATITSSNYNGILIIPETIKVEDVEYSVTAIDNYAFRENSKLLSVTIPESVKSIGISAFTYCTSLTSVKLGDGVEEIGNRAFSYCRELQVIHFGKNVKKINDIAFNYCDGLKQIYISDLTMWCNIDFYSESSNPLTYAHHLYLDKKELENLVIPQGIEVIKQYTFDGGTNIKSLVVNSGVSIIEQSAFKNCSSISTVNLPESLINIGNDAFFGCSSINEISLPNSITSIEERVFADCSELEKLLLPESLKIIKSSAFQNCNSLKNIIIPSNVEFIYYYAFYNTSDNQQTIIMMPEYPPIVYSNAFSNRTKFVVPDESLELYESVSPWSDFEKNTFSGSGPEKCAEPEIIYKDGKLSFTCQTPGVEFHYTVTSEDFANRQKGEEIPVSAIYQVSVYASKAGYENSDTVTSEIDIKGIKGDLTGDGIVNVADHVELTKIIMKQNKDM